MKEDGIICSYEGRQYLAGTELSDADGRCLVCIDGKWEEKATDVNSCHEAGILW